ncbi:MAG TPA: aliphatic sulfonates ABC transporter substrate-binding protein, partial [Candidatus Limnocylindria bacterium]
MHLALRTTVRPIRAGALLAIAAVIAACGGAAVPAPTATTAPGVSAAAVADPALAELRIDYATYSPPSLVLKKQGSLEQALPGTTIKWVYSAGSSNALNFLQG